MSWDIIGRRVLLLFLLFLFRSLSSVRFRVGSVREEEGLVKGDVRRTVVAGEEEIGVLF
jgi:hypothetical protein